MVTLAKVSVGPRIDLGLEMSRFGSRLSVVLSGGEAQGGSKGWQGGGVALRKVKNGL